MRAPSCKRWSILAGLAGLILASSAARADEPAAAPAKDAAAAVSADAPQKDAAPAVAAPAEPKKDEAKAEETKKEEAKKTDAAPAPQEAAAPAASPAAPAALPAPEPAVAAPAATPVPDAAASAAGTPSSPAATAPATPLGTATVAGAAAKADQPLLYKGFMFDLTVLDSSSLNTLNYTNQGILYLEPSWAVGKAFLKGTPFEKLMLAGRVVVNGNFAGYDPGTVSPEGDAGYAPTCNGMTQSQSGAVTSCGRAGVSVPHRTTLNDTWLTAALPGITTIPGTGIKMGANLRLVLPTSLESQYATLRLGTALSVGFSRMFLDDSLKIGLSVGGTKNWHGSTAPRTDLSSTAGTDGAVTYNYNLKDVVSTSQGFYSDVARTSSGGLNVQWGLSNILSADYTATKKLSFSVLYIQLHSFSYAPDPSTCLLQAGGTTVDACANANEVAKTSNGSGTTGVRAISDLQIFWATANYQLYPWMGLSLAWITASPLRYPDNSFRQPFISTNYDAFTQVSLGATFSFNHPDEG